VPGNADATQQLDSLRNRVHQFDLLSEMLIEQQMELGKSWTGNLPVRFLIQVSQHHRVSEQ
jgi:hypothetical protein